MVRPPKIGTRVVEFCTAPLYAIFSELRMRTAFTEE